MCTSPGQASQMNIIYATILCFEVVYTNFLIIILTGDWSPVAGFQPV